VKAWFQSLLSNAMCDATQWAHQHGLPLMDIDNPGAVTVAAGTGKVDIVAWLHDELGFECNENTCYIAARKGHESVLTYLRENDCPWDQGCYYTKCTKWAVSNGVLQAEKYSSFQAKKARDDLARRCDSDSSEGSIGGLEYRCGCRVECAGCRRGFECQQF
jgi:hypothetical protein